MSSKIYGRIVEIYVGSKSAETAVKISDLKIDFSVKKDSARANNDADLTIWNMSEETAARFEKAGASVVIKAGHAGRGAGILFAGSVERTTVVKNHADRGLKIELADGSELLRVPGLSLSWKGKTYPATIVSTILKSIGAPTVIAEPVKGPIYYNGFVAYGPPLKVLDKVLRRCGYVYSIQNGEIRIYKEKAGDSVTLSTLTFGSDLLKNPTKLNLSKSEAKKHGNKVGYLCESILNPSLTPGAKVKVISPAVTGILKVYSINSFGDNKAGEYKTITRIFEQ